jgi:hypothetical protein
MAHNITYHGFTNEERMSTKFMKMSTTFFDEAIKTITKFPTGKKIFKKIDKVFPSRGRLHSAFLVASLMFDNPSDIDVIFSKW